jgi:putative phosphoribosyl transferase
LADRLAQMELIEPMVLGLPRGGVPVAAEVASRLDAPLDVVVARKVTMPGQPEYAIGAVAEGSGAAVLRGGPADFGISTTSLERAVEASVVDVGRRVEMYRGGRPLPALAGRTAIIVDDGLATGATVEAAIGAVRAVHATSVLVAVPVGAPDTVARLSELAEVVCLSRPDPLMAVGLWYDDFTQTTDAEVLRLLA